MQEDMQFLMQQNSEISIANAASVSTLATRSTSTEMILVESPRRHGRKSGTVQDPRTPPKVTDSSGRAASKKNRQSSSPASNQFAAFLERTRDDDDDFDDTIDYFFDADDPVAVASEKINAMHLKNPPALGSNEAGKGK
jgi:hypothetical protein